MMADEKVQLRERFRHDRRERDRNVSFELLMAAPEITSAQVIATYISYGTEPSTQEINRYLLEAGHTLVLPRINGDYIQWVQWDGDPLQLKLNGRILEPLGQEFLDLPAINAAIVPALHIDSEGYRLGKGGGYYDRALPMIDGWKVGLIYSGELSEELLPREHHDAPLNAAATPDEVVRF